MLRLDVGPDAVRVIKSKKTGQEYRVCEAYAHTLDPRTGKPHLHPTRCEFFLQDEQQAPAPGSYLLAPASVYVDRGGRLVVAPKLVPAPLK
jgi:hypothetical protein